MATETQNFTVAELGEVRNKSGKFIRELVQPGMSFLHREFQDNPTCTITEVTDKAVVYVRESDESEHEIARHRIAGIVDAWEDSPNVRAAKKVAWRKEIVKSLEGIRNKELDKIDDIESDPYHAWLEIIEAVEAVSLAAYEAGYSAGYRDGQNSAVPTAN